MENSCLTHKSQTSRRYFFPPTKQNKIRRRRKQAVKKVCYGHERCKGLTTITILTREREKENTDGKDPLFYFRQMQVKSYPQLRASNILGYYSVSQAESYFKVTSILLHRNTSNLRNNFYFLTTAAKDIIKQTDKKDRYHLCTKFTFTFVLQN